MPWKEASPMDQRTQLIADYLRETLSITELCEVYGVTRKTGYKWIDRYLRQGPAGLEERSRRPRRAPNETSEEIVAAILEARRHHPSWGWCPGAVSVGGLDIPANRRARFWPPTTSGVPTTRGSSGPATAGTAIH